MSDPSAVATSALDDPALSIGLALAVGMLAQALARHLRVPGIVLLLAAGVVLGPDVLGLIRPAALGDTLPMLVGFAVAVILFEGGMALDIRRLRRSARSIQRLVTIGALVTAAGGTLTARWVLGWDWPQSALFGSLVIVTGPTVINPLLRRIRLKPRLATVLEAEGVLIDAIGAILAVFTLEIVLAPTAESLTAGAGHLLLRLGLGAAIGGLGGALIAGLLRFRSLVPEGLVNVFVLSMVLALFQISDALLHESGIVAVTVAGLVVGNVKSHALNELKEFKEELTVMLIGLLFVLLAADVRLAEIEALGWRGALAVAALMLVVRPLNALASTWGSELDGRERAFVAWLAPRGIVAAAVTSLFAQQLAAAGIPGGAELRALVFLLIAATVLIQGLSGGPIAGLLGLRRPSHQGYVILGANHLGLALGGILRDGGHEVLFLDSNADAVSEAEGLGFRVMFGNALTEQMQARAEMEARAACIGVTVNDEVNLLFARKAREDSKVPHAWVALRLGHTSVSSAMVEAVGARVLFGEPRRSDLWAARLERGLASVESWLPGDRGEDTLEPHEDDKLFLPLASRRGSEVRPFTGWQDLRKADELYLLVFDEQRSQAETRLTAHGWRRGGEGAEASQHEDSP